MNWSCHFKHQLCSIFTKYYPYIDIKVVPYNLRSIQSFFKYIDSTPHLMRSKVVYIYSCLRCARGTYIGSTLRRLRDRICEHMGVSVRTLCQLNDPHTLLQLTQPYLKI